jgi:hypothetical protein
MLPHKPQQHHRGHIVGVWGGQKGIEFHRKTALGYLKTYDAKME